MTEQILCILSLVLDAYIFAPLRNICFKSLVHAHMGIGTQILLSVFSPPQGVRGVSVGFWGDLQWQLAAAESLEDYFLPASSRTLVSQTS